MDEIKTGIEALVEQARISGEVPDYPTDYRAAYKRLIGLIEAYASSVALAQRERDAQAVEATVYPRSGEDYDEWRAAMLMRDYCAAAIRAL